MTDSMTVLAACLGEGVLAKRVTPQGVQPYDRATFFDFIEVQVTNLAAVARRLKILVAQPRAAVVRGNPLTTERRTLRRLVHNDKTRNYPATLGSCSHSWVAIDLDDLPFPIGVVASDLAACGLAGREALPEAFQGGTCIVQATASHGLKPTMRLRLWFWLDRKTTDSELKQWLARSPADLSLFSPAQLHYVAAPIFEGGMVDPLPSRLTFILGTDVVTVPPPEALTPPPRRAWTPPAFSCSEAAAGTVRSTLLKAVGTIREAEIGDRHNTIIKAATRSAWLVANGWLGEEAWRAALQAAASDVAPGSEGRVSDALNWALAHAPTPGAEFPADV